MLFEEQKVMKSERKWLRMRKIKADEALQLDMWVRETEGQKNLVMSQSDSLDFDRGQKVKFQHKIGVSLAAGIRYPFISDTLFNNHKNNCGKNENRLLANSSLKCFQLWPSRNFKPDVMVVSQAMPFHYNNLIKRGYVSIWKQLNSVGNQIYFIFNCDRDYSIISLYNMSLFVKLIY